MSQAVKSAVRVFEILEIFGKARQPLRLKDFVNQLEYPTSSIAALLKSMTGQGYLSFDAEARSYMPTSRLAKLVNWVPIGVFEQGVVLDAMRNLQRTTHELVVLGVESGIYLEYVETLRSTQGIQLYIAPGTRRLLIITAMGWQLLSRRSEAEAVEVYRRTIASGELEEREFPLAEYLKEIREHRNLDIAFIKARELVRPVAHWGGGMVSMLVPSPPGHRPLAIGIGGPAERLEEKLDKISEALRSEIERITLMSEAAPSE